MARSEHLHFRRPVVSSACVPQNVQNRGDTGVVRNGVRESGKWVLRYRTEKVTPEEGDAYNVYTVYTEFMKTGFKISIR